MVNLNRFQIYRRRHGGNGTNIHAPDSGIIIVLPLSPLEKSYTPPIEWKLEDSLSYSTEPPPDTYISLSEIRFYIGWLTSKRSTFFLLGLTISIAEEVSYVLGIFITFASTFPIWSIDKNNEEYQ